MWKDKSVKRLHTGVLPNGKQSGNSITLVDNY